MIYINNWIELTENEYETVWEKVNKQFKFKPSISEFPSYIVPHPFITYDVSLTVQGLVEFENLNKDLEEKSILAFQEITQKNEYIYALDWQHDCYWVNFHIDIPKDEDGSWFVPVYPDGDYSFFFSRNLEFGYLGDPWEKTVTIFGEKLIKAFNKDAPSLFQNVLRVGKI